LAWGLTVYAAGTARATSSDLLLFWGAKGQRFAQAGAIDVEFLRQPDHLLMHSDYPPMLPCLFAWATLTAGRFAWGAALLTLPLFLGLAAISFFGFARPALGLRSAAECTALLVALVGFVMIVTLMAGNADPLLVYFEVLALSALTLGSGRPGADVAAGIGLAGAVLTKVEGTVFAALLVGSFLLFGEGRARWRRALRMGAPAAAALVSWMAFCGRYGLTSIYSLSSQRPATMTHFSAAVSGVLHEASYGAAYIPWLVVAALGLRGRNTASTRMNLAVAAGFLGFVLYMYLTSPTDARLWIIWSASRLLLTPLLSIFFAAVASQLPGLVGGCKTCPEIGARSPEEEGTGSRPGTGTSVAGH
jgi:hypothetical protein